MAVEGKTILQTTERTELTGKEGIPFQEGTQNGHVLLEKIKEYISSDVYICPGAFQTTEGWYTTDVESIVGNWDEFTKAVSGGKIIVGYFQNEGQFVKSTASVIEYDGVTFLSFSFYQLLCVYIIDQSYITIVTIDNFLCVSSVVDRLNSSGTELPLSANQGRILNEKIERLNTIIENTTESTKELQANTYYVFGEVETLTLTLAAEENWMISEYMFEFTSGTTPTVITPIDGVEWRGDTIEANKVYQASIVRGIGILVGRDIA